MHLLILGGSSDDRRRTARESVPAGAAPIALDARTLPFVRARSAALPPPPRLLIIDDVDRAFLDVQTPGTHLVLTQSTYLMQTWLDTLDERDRIVATADRTALLKAAPEALQARGPWARFEIVDIAITKDREDTEDTKATPLVVSGVPGPTSRLLASAYASADPAERRRLCQEAAAREPSSPVAWLALASACREMQDVGGARDAIAQAAALAPDWEAVPFEAGKLWLAYDDLDRARDAFQRAGQLMPTFSAAFSNLGAALGELDDTDGALAAFEQALAHDSHSFTILNNVGIVSRELGRLVESEAALRRVVALAPEFVFGHYNLGHTLFLAGKYREALAAYEEGHRRDPDRNTRQACRMAVMRLATGDAAGAERDLWRFANAASPDERDDLLLEAYEIVDALMAAHPALGAHRAFLDRLGAEIAKSE